MCDSNKKTNNFKSDNSKAISFEFINYNDFWFNHKEYNKIENGLILGSDVPIKDLNCMEMLEISHIISVIEEPVAEQYRFGHINYIHVEAGDFPDEDLLSSFEYCFKIIANAQKNDENVYVHCGSGVSRSATIVIAFIMKKYKISFLDAIRRVSKKRKVFPNEGFTEQLGLFERMDWIGNGYNEEYRRFLLKSLTYQLRTDRLSSNSCTYTLPKPRVKSSAERQLTFNYEMNCVRNYFEKIGKAEQLAEEQKLEEHIYKGQTYHCYVCNTELFNAIHIIGDDWDKQLMATSCDHIFIEPLQTYCTQSDNEKTGFMKCPNCLSVFGLYNWLLFQCNCASHQKWKECLALKVFPQKITF